MKRFLINLGYTWTVDTENVDGYIFNSSGFTAEQAQRRSFEDKKDLWVLFDPQLYLTCLDGTACLTTCSKLATYPWFNTDTPDFKSGIMSQRDWFQSVKESLIWAPKIPEDKEEISTVMDTCLSFQKNFDVTHYIIPTPLIDTSEDGVTLKQVRGGKRPPSQRYRVPPALCRISPNGKSMLPCEASFT